MAVTAVYLLRKASGSVDEGTSSIVAHYRVVVDDEYDGPDAALSYFPLGQVADEYLPWERTDQLDGRYPSRRYAWPTPETGCSGGEYQEELGAGIGIGFLTTPLYISSVSIVGRGKGDTDKLSWVVAVTYSSNKERGILNSVREIVPYYMYDDQPQDYGAFMGGYKRVVGSRASNTGPSQPGQWELINDQYYDKRSIIYESKSDPESPTELKPILVMNSAGIPFEGKLSQRVARPAFKCSWFSYTALDFTEAVGKVNSKKYDLVAWDSSVGWPQNTCGVEKLITPVVIFHRCFNERELLVHNVDCDLVNWGGKNCYKYTVDLIYDRDGHDKYLIDQGFSERSIVGDDTASGGKVEARDGNEVVSPTTPILEVGTDTPIRTEALLDGNGRKLLTYNSDGSIEKGPTSAVYLKYRVHEEVEFFQQKTKPGEDMDFDKLREWQTGDSNIGLKAKCPLFWDGGLRYSKIRDIEEVGSPSINDYALWPDGKCRTPDPGNESRYQ